MSAARVDRAVAQRDLTRNAVGSDRPIGHSQGGLLVKMLSIHSGDRLWNAISHKPLDELNLSPDTRESLRRALFVEPLPYVSRVIFVATPQRGSYVAGRQLIADLMRRLTRVPFEQIPVDPSIHAHSIIAVEGNGPVEQGDDGVVEYESAHIDEAESELAVRSSHSCQGNPATLEEVRRILRLHVGLPTREGPAGAP